LSGSIVYEDSLAKTDCKQKNEVQKENLGDSPTSSTAKF